MDSILAQPQREEQWGVFKIESQRSQSSYVHEAVASAAISSDQCVPGKSNLEVAVFC